jgi:hypothetical protein
MCVEKSKFFKCSQKYYLEQQMSHVKLHCIDFKTHCFSSDAADIPLNCCGLNLFKGTQRRCGFQKLLFVIAPNIFRSLFNLIFIFFQNDYFTKILINCPAGNYTRFYEIQNKNWDFNLKIRTESLL